MLKYNKQSQQDPDKANLICLPVHKQKPDGFKIKVIVPKSLQLYFVRLRGLMEQTLEIQPVSLGSIPAVTFHIFHLSWNFTG